MTHRSPEREPGDSDKAETSQEGAAIDAPDESTPEQPVVQRMGTPLVEQGEDDIED